MSMGWWMYGGFLLLLILDKSYQQYRIRPKLMSDYKKVYYVVAGDNFKVKCPIDVINEDDGGYIWRNKFVDLMKTLDEDVSVKRARLLIQNVTKRHEGEYECEGTNGYGTEYAYIYLFVTADDRPNKNNKPLYKPKFTSQYEKIRVVKENQDVLFDCHYRSNPPATIFWYRNETKLKETGSLFKIQTVIKSDSGKYRCLIRNVLGSIERIYTLKVKSFFDRNNFGNVKFHNYNREISVRRTQNVQLNCQVELTNPDPGDTILLRWAKLNTGSEVIDLKSLTADYYDNMKYIMNDSKIKKSKQFYQSELKINSAIIENAGYYACVVIYNNGFYSDLFNLQIDDSAISGENVEEDTTKVIIIATSSAAVLFFLIFILVCVYARQRTKSTPRSARSTKSSSSGSSCVYKKCTPTPPPPQTNQQLMLSYYGQHPQDFGILSHHTTISNDGGSSHSHERCYNPQQQQQQLQYIPQGPIQNARYV